MPASKLQSSCAGLQSHPGGHPHVHSVGKGTSAVKVGLIVRLGHNVTLVTLSMLVHIDISSVAVSVSGLVVTVVEVAVTVAVVVTTSVETIV